MDLVALLAGVGIGLGLVSAVVLGLGLTLTLRRQRAERIARERIAAAAGDVKTEVAKVLAALAAGVRQERARRADRNGH